MQSGATESGTSCIGAEDDFTWRICVGGAGDKRCRQKKAARDKTRERERGQVSGWNTSSARLQSGTHFRVHSRAVLSYRWRSVL